MSYVDKILQPDERVVATGKKHWIIYWPGISTFIVVVLVLLASSRLPQLGAGLLVLAALLGLFGLVLLGRAWIHQWSTEIVVTNRRVIYKTGIISRYTTETNMDKIESVDVDQSLLGRILGFGTISGRGTGEGIENLKRIAAPLRLRNAITAR